MSDEDNLTIEGFIGRGCMSTINTALNILINYLPNS